jgi:hypothetical protein
MHSIETSKMMNSTHSDIALTITSNGRVSHYAGIKDVGNLIWDLRSGIFDSTKPGAANLFSYAQSTGWLWYIGPIESGVPPSAPTYGTISIDFDSRRLVDANDRGASNVIFISMLERCIVTALAGDDDWIPRESLRAHLAAGRIELVDGDGNDQSVPGKVLAAKCLEDALGELRALPRTARAGFARLRLPTDWTTVVRRKDE